MPINTSCLDASYVYIYELALQGSMDQYLGILLVLAMCISAGGDSVIGADNADVAEVTSSPFAELRLSRVVRGGT